VSAVVVPRAAILTVSTSRAGEGGGADEGGPKLAALAGSLGAEVTTTEIVPDDRKRIAERLRHLCDEAGHELVLTTGGTGFSPDDVTPEATRDVIERDAPGLAEAIRLASREHTRLWMVSRGVAGTRGGTLIVNFPGSPKAIDEVGPAVADGIAHALSLLRR
jgi:molybdenum cofactor synthesis domain-containing protein